MKRSLVWGAALITASLALGIPAAMGALDSVDRPVLAALALQQAQPPGWDIAVTRFVTQLGDPSWRSVFVVIALAVLMARQCWRSATIYVVASALSIFGHSVAKEVFGRARPDVVPHLDIVTNLSYPSGHAAGTMVVLLLAALLIGGRWMALSAVALAIVIGLSRVLLGVHWPSDVIGGWLFGGGAALIGWSAVQRVRLPHPLKSPDLAPNEQAQLEH